MRIWSVHPKYLDAKGLVALWRETLLAKKVLEGNTKGYKNHPQLNRFKLMKEPLHAINQYLMGVYKESIKRGYRFDKTKINKSFKPQQITVTQGQIQFEIQHLLAKLSVRDAAKYNELLAVNSVDTHSMFLIIEGDVEDWEIV